jgi:hypothetical protein
VRAPVVKVPSVACSPDHAPDASQRSAPVDDHDNRAVPPDDTLVGVTANDTTGGVAAAWSRAAPAIWASCASLDIATRPASPSSATRSAFVIAPVNAARAFEGAAAPSNTEYFRSTSSGSVVIIDASASRAWPINSPLTGTLRVVTDGSIPGTTV